MIPWSSSSCEDHSSPSSDARAVRDVSLHVLLHFLHFLARGLVLLPEQGLLPSSASSCIDSSSPPSPTSIVHSPHQLVPTVVLQEPVPSSSQPCRRKSSAAQPLKTRHIHCVSWSLYPQVKHPHVALSTEVCDLPRLVVLDKAFFLAQVDLISSLCDLGNAQKKTLHWANFPDDPAALSLIHSASHRPLASRGNWMSPRASEDLS